MSARQRATRQLWRQAGGGGAGVLHYSLNQESNFGAALVPLLNTLSATPFVVPERIQIAQLGILVTVPAVLGECRVGLYRNTSKRTLYPTSLIVDAGIFSTAAAAYVTGAAASGILEAGLYWAVTNFGVAAPTVQCVTATAKDAMLGWTPAGLGLVFGLQVASAYGPLPAAFPGGAAYSAGNVAMVFGEFA